IRVTGNKNDREGDIAAGEFADETEAVRSGHFHIRNYASNISLIELLKKTIGRLVGLYAVTGHAEHLAQRGADRGVIVDDGDCRGGHCHYTSDWSRGTENRNSVAPASRLWSHTRPPWASTIEALIERPRPRPSCFEVASGSNKRLACSSSTPGPLS